MKLFHTSKTATQEETLTQEEVEGNFDTDEQQAKIWVTVCKYILVALIPVIAFFLMEAYEHNPFVEVRSLAVIFNIVLFELIAWLFFFVTGGARFALRLELGLAMAFGITNHYVMAFRATPFVPWDILSIKTAASVANNYDFTPSKRMVFVTLGFLLLMSLVHFLDVKLKKKPFVRIGGGVLCLLALCLFTNRLQDEDFQNRNYLYPFLFTPAYMTKVNGMAVTFAMNLKYVVVEKPQGYSVKEVQKIEASYESSSTSLEGDYPNIIVVMDEAFSDLGVLGQFETSEDYMPYVHSILDGAENTISGYANVSVCGGNTANSEFEFLTGCSMAFLPAGSIPYQQYVKDTMPSLASYLKSLGYDTYGQHPYNASGWNRDKVYPMLGIDYTTFISDYKYRNYVRKYVSDKSDFQEIIYAYENRDKSKPMFLFNVTMQNHGGYTDSYDNFTPDVTVNDMNSSVVSQYLSLVKKSDYAVEELVDYFSKVDEKTVIVFFGDHQPNDAVARLILAANGIDYQNLTDEQLAQRYKVPYFIWANYDITEETNKETSLNYLAAQTLEAAGVQTSGYMNFLLDLQKQYPVITAIRKEEASDAQASKADKLLADYQKLQYYYLFDWEE